MVDAETELAPADLLLFINELPVGLAEFDRAGEIRVINASFVNLLMPLLTAGDTIDLLATLDRLAPGVADRIRQSGPERGALCEAVVVPPGLIGGARNAPSPCYGLWVHQLAPGRYTAMLARVAPSASQ